MRLRHDHRTEQSVFDSRFETRCLRTYFGATLSVAARGRLAGGHGLQTWIKEFGSKIGIPGPLCKDVAKRGPRLIAEDAERLLLAVEGCLRSQRPPAPSALERRLRWICETLKLSADEASILKLCVRSALFEPLHDLACAPTDDHRMMDEITYSSAARMLGRPRTMIAERLRPYRPLRQLGLIEDRGDEEFAPSSTVMRLARSRHSDPEQLGRELFGAPLPSLLTWDDFDHLGESRDLAVRLLETAMQRKTRGIGILLYGVPGTGKTEFAKALAARLSAKPVFIGETDESQGEPSRADRVAHYAFTSVLAARAGRTLLVVDEADDIFTGVDEDDRASRIGSKVFYEPPRRALRGADNLDHQQPGEDRRCCGATNDSGAPIPGSKPCRTKTHCSTSCAYSPAFAACRCDRTACRCRDGTGSHRGWAARSGARWRRHR